MQPEAAVVSGDQSMEELRRELAEARDQQAATSEILKVISSSPTDLQRMFAMMAASAARLLDAFDATIFQVDGDLLRHVADHGSIPQDYTLPLTREVVTGRAVLDGRTILVTDVQAETEDYPDGSDRARRVGHRTILAVPLMRAGHAIGVISIRRTEVRPFSDRQIDLLKTFADQAVIAIENTRLFAEVQARTRELTESLEYQTATGEVLGVISRSPTNVQPVFETIARSAAVLCGAPVCNVFRFDGQLIHIAASHSPSSHAVPPEAQKANATQPPIQPGRASAAARSIATKSIAEISDIDADPEYRLGEVARIANLGSTMAVPMLKDGRPIGAIALGRFEKGRFPKRQIELLRTFAEQAVIAIENARLFEEVQTRTKELQDSLDRQTATSEVLGVISRSPNEVQPVLDTIMATAQRLCQAERAIVWRLEGETFRAVAHRGQPEERVESVYSARIPLSRGSMSGRATLARRAVQVEDVATDPELVGAARAVEGRAHRRHHTVADPGRAVR